jgi:hypothetical protein
LQEYLELMTSELTNQEDPLDANMEKVLPGLHQWHRINNEGLSKLKGTVQDLTSSVSDLGTKFDTSFHHLSETLKSNNAELKEEMAYTFMDVARRLLQSGGGAVDNSTLDELVHRPRITQEPVHDPEESVIPAQDEVTGMNEDDPAIVHQLFRMVPKHLVLLDLVHEWFGTGDYYDSYGGIEGRNSACKKVGPWRTHCGIDKMHYSRTERTVRAVKEYGLLNSVDMYVAAERLQSVFEECKCSVSNFVKWAQQQTPPLIATRKARGRAAITPTQNIDQ